MPHMRVIVHPVAGKGAGMRESARHLLYEHGLASDMVFTERPGHAIELARAALQSDYDADVAAGGNGTANEVLSARPDDGWLDLVLAQQVNRSTMLALVGRYLRGTQLSHRRIKAMRARRVRVQAEGGLNSYGDGEVFMIGGQTLQFEALPQQIDVICSEEGGR